MSPNAPALLIRARVLQMMAALTRAGGTPIDAASLHAFAFFSNVLSPLWELEPLDGAILKERSGPYYPALQTEIDWLIGEGLINVVALMPGPNKMSLGAVFTSMEERARSVLALIRALPDEGATEEFLVELALAYLEIRADRRDDAALADASYSDPSVALGRIIDFAEWVKPTTDNPSWNTAESFQRYMPEGVTLDRAEKLLMYMRLLRRRANG